MDFAVALLLPIGIVFVFCCLFIMIGGIVSRDIFNEKGTSYRFSLCFFVGLICFLAVLRTVALIIRSYRFAFWLVLLAYIGWVAVNMIRKYRVSDVRMILVHYRKLIVSWLLLWFAHIFYQLIIWFANLEQTVLTPSTSVGSQHSIRYTNIAAYFTDYDYIPILNQSYGQSLLGSFGTFFGIDNINFFMSVWLAAGKTFMVLFLFGLFYKYFNRLLSILLTVVVFCGSVSLSAYPIKVLDTGSPFFYSGYTDSIVGACSFYIFLVFMFHILSDKEKLTVKHYAFTFCMMLYWCMSAPQNIVVIGGIGFFILLYLLWKKEFQLVTPTLCIAGAVLVGAGVGILEGGMLTPSSLIEDVNIEGIMTVAIKTGSVKISLVPSMPYFIDSDILQKWSYEIPYMENTLQYAVEGLNKGDIGICLYHLGILCWDSVRIIFWPLMGTLGMMWEVYKRRERQIIYWSFAGVIALGIGWIIAFVFSYCELKRELTRFMMPCYFLCMIFMAVLLGKLYERDKICRCICICSMFMILCGQIPYRLIENIEVLQTDQIAPLLKQMITFVN
ncbi:MAG: hypothetical protein HDR17_08255 [Lachnospiraceae bacterium]|nr:hypothetical protein [Lachnospiraceae bacterium]